MIVSGGGGGSGGDRRWASRRSISLDADLADSAGLTFAAKVTDISEEGCMVRLADGHSLARDRLHSVKVTGLETLSAYVIWCADGKAGLAFSEPLDPATVQTLVMRWHYARIGRQGVRRHGPEDGLPPLRPFPFES